MSWSDFALGEIHFLSGGHVAIGKIRTEQIPYVLKVSLAAHK